MNYLQPCVDIEIDEFEFIDAIIEKSQEELDYALHLLRMICGARNEHNK